MKKVRRAPDSQRLDKENLSDKATVPKQVLTQNILYIITTSRGFRLHCFERKLELIKYSLNVIVYSFGFVLLLILKFSAEVILWLCIIANSLILKFQMKSFDESDKSEATTAEVEKLLDLLQKLYRENERKRCMNLNSQ